MKTPYQHIAGFVSKNPKIITAIVLIWFFISLYGMTQVTMKTGDETYIDKTTPRGILLDDYKELFSSDSIMVIFESDSITNPDFLNFMNRIMTDFSNERG
ncbi:MAG: RND family transporter, partial [Methanomicrobium sp.]|nr:RND family transporter [Methanomicrobium sp.]